MNLPYHTVNYLEIIVWFLSVWYFCYLSSVYNFIPLCSNSIFYINLSFVLGAGQNLFCFLSLKHWKKCLFIEWKINCTLLSYVVELFYILSDYLSDYLEKCLECGTYIQQITVRNDAIIHFTTTWIGLQDIIC